MRLLFVRHPKTKANASDLIYGRTESDYSEEGLASIPWIVKQLHGVPFGAIYASPLQRTRILAEKIAADHSIEEIIYDDRLLEMHFGVLENTTQQEATTKYKEYYDAFIADYENYVVPGGESFQQVKERTADFLEYLVTQHSREPDPGKLSPWEEFNSKPDEEKEALEKTEKTVLIVAHSMVIHGALSHLLKIDLHEIWHIRIDPGTIVDIDYEYDFAMLRSLKSPERD